MLLQKLLENVPYLLATLQYMIIFLQTNKISAENQNQHAMPFTRKNKQFCAVAKSFKKIRYYLKPSKKSVLEPKHFNKDVALSFLIDAILKYRFEY